MRRYTAPHSDAQSRRPRWRRIEALLAVIFMAGQLLGTLHFAVVQHVVCLEHGEVSHVSPANGLDRWVLPSPDDSLAVLSAQAGWNQSGADHQHCLLQALRRESATGVGEATPQSVELVRQRDTDFTDRKEKVQLALFRLAPKHSPPA